MYRARVSEEGFGVQRWDTGHRRWDVDAGHGMQKWDGGAGHGMLQPQSTTAQPQLCTGILQHPWRWGVRARSREMQTSKEKVIAFQPHTDILQLVPHLGGRSQPFGHICLPDVLGGEQSPCGWETSPLPCVQARLGMQLHHITPALEKCLDGTREQWEGRAGWDQSTSQMIFIAMFLSCGWGRWQ